MFKPGNDGASGSGIDGMPANIDLTRSDTSMSRMVGEQEGDTSQLQLVLRTPQHAAFYDRASRLVTLHSSSNLAGPSTSSPHRSSGSLALLPHQHAGPLTTTAQVHSGIGISTPVTLPQACPACLRPFQHPDMPEDVREHQLPSFQQAQRRLPHADINAIAPAQDDEFSAESLDGTSATDEHNYVAPNYFRLLATASVPPSRASSRPGTPIIALVTGEDEDSDVVDSADASEVEMEASTGRPATLPSRFHGFISNSISTSSATRSLVDSENSHIPPRSSLRGQRSSAATASRTRQRLRPSEFSQGYFERFFVRVRKLGRGARGTVWLCQHVLGGQKLGEYAVKQVPIGDYADDLMASLKEVQLLETLRHPNIIHYQHAWVEEAQVGPFTPRVPTLHVLMMAANGGSLADWISARSGNPASTRSSKASDPLNPSEPGEAQASKTGRTVNYAKHFLGSDSMASSGPPSPGLVAQRLRNERLKTAVRLKRMQRRAADGDDESGNPAKDDRPEPSSLSAAASPILDEPHAQHLLGEQELFSLLRDMASGLGWLHERGVLHLDIKPENVLLHWEQPDDMLPRALLSDFGSSTFLQGNWRRIRSGHTGTMDFMAPEAIFPDPVTGTLQELTSKSDVWSLGMVLHLCVYFQLPYRHTDNIDRLREEMEAYAGYTIDDERNMHRAKVPSVLSMLLRRMLQRNPVKRPTCDEILAALASAGTTASASASHSPTAHSHGTGALGNHSASSALVEDGNTGTAATSGALALRRPRFTPSPIASEGIATNQALIPASIPVQRPGVAGGVARLLTSPSEEQRWIVVLSLAVVRSVWTQLAAARGVLGPGGAWACGVLVLVEVALASRRPSAALSLFVFSLSLQIAIVATAASSSSWRRAPVLGP